MMEIEYQKTSDYQSVLDIIKKNGFKVGDESDQSDRTEKIL
jgi:hypothetical protein